MHQIYSNCKCSDKSLVQNFRPASSLCPVVVIISATAATLSVILRTNRFQEVNRPLWQLLLSDNSVTHGIKEIYLNLRKIT